MSEYLGDFYPGCTVYGSFTTVTTTGAPTVLTGNPAPSLTAYKDAYSSSGCSTTGLTLATNCNGRTGWNAFSVATTDAFYSCGHNYEVVLNGGTVGGTCVQGYTVARFSLVNRAGLLPQNYGKRLTLTTGGAVNVNWAGVENCTNATTLSCTTAYSVVKVVDRPIADICSTIFSVQKVIDTSNIGAGAAPSANSIACTVWESLFTNHSATCGSYGYLLNCQVSAALQPEIPGRRLAVASTGEAGINWARVANCTTAQSLSCTTAYSVIKVTDQVVTHPCSTIFSSQKLIDTSNIGTGAAPSANSIACTVWNSVQDDYVTAGTFGLFLDAAISGIQAGSGPSANSIACTVWESLFTTHSATCGSYGYLLNCQVSAALQPEIPGRRLAVASTGEAGINWARVANCTTAQTLSCTTAYSVVKLLDASNTGGGTPPTASQIADEVQTRNVGINWANISNCGTVQDMVCTKMFSVVGVTGHVNTNPCSTVYSITSVANNVNINPCSTVFSVVSKVEAHPCSRILSVQSVLNNVPGVTGSVGSVVGDVGGSVQGNVDGSVGSVTGGVTVTTNNDKTGYALSTAGYACVWSAPIHEPSNVPGWPMSGCTALGWVAALASNCLTQTATVQSLCNRALSTTISSARITCSSTIVHRGTFGTSIP
jgi:hypothetical protein